MSLGVVPADPAINAPGSITASASNPAVIPAAPRLRADLKGNTAPDEVQLVADWIMRDNRHQGNPFIVADKVAGLLFAFDASGALIAKAPALFGRARGDVLTEEQANKTLEQTTRADMITPAGVFPAEAYVSPRYGDSVRFAGYKHTNLLIHRAPGEMRRALLQNSNTNTNTSAKSTSSDNRITLGCINMPPEFIDNVLMPNFSGKSLVVVLPESQSARSFFAINDADVPTRLASNKPSFPNP